MKKTVVCAPLLLAAMLLVVFSCKKEDQDASAAALTQTKTFSSDVVQQWLTLQSAMLYDPASKSTPSYGLNVHRYLAYTGVALYEAVVPGMPDYQSLSGQLNQMPQMPKTESGKAYHWPTCANAALATVTRNLFGPFYNPATGDALEQELNQAYSAALGDSVRFNRSVAFGKAVGAKIVEWSAGDRPWANREPYRFPEYQPGHWGKPETSVPNGLAYWGDTRPMVAGSLDNVASPPLAYSEDPASPYYQQMQEVYRVSKNLQRPERIQAKYYDDPAAKGYPSGASYYPLLQQVITQLDPTLEQAALAYAKAGISLLDGSIGSFRAKFAHNTERPVQFIQRVLAAGDPAAAQWASYIPTPAHPDFPSNHAVFSSSFAYALTSVFGDSVPLSNSTYAGKTVELGGGLGAVELGRREYTSFTSMMKDISYSRLYGGIHTRYACEEGLKQGTKTAQNIDRLIKFKKE
jgi:hypothetical protein